MEFFKARELRDQRAGLAEDARLLLVKAREEKRDMTTDETQTFDRIHEDIEKISRQVEQIDKQNDVLAKLREPRDTQAGGKQFEKFIEKDKAPESPPLDRWMREGPRGINAEERKILGIGEARGGSAAIIPLGDPGAEKRTFRSIYGYTVGQTEQRAQSVGTVGEGGYLRPEGFYSTLTESLLAFGGMRQARTTILRTDTGQVLPMPTVDDTSNTGALLAENVEVAEQDFTFSEVQLDAYKYTSKAVRVSSELLNDSAFNLPAFIGRALGTRLGRITNTDYTTGTGSSKPAGVVTGASSGKTAAATGAVTYVELLDLKHSVDPAYRSRAEWMFNDSSLKALKQLLDGQSRPLWQAGMSASQPNTIDGDPYVINQDVASMATTTKPILYGDFASFIIRDVKGVRLLRLDERYAEYDQVAFVAFLRTDSVLLDAGTDPIKYITMA